MSSTKRGGQRSPADNYPTPAWCVHRFAERYDFTRNGTRTRFLEPCVGDGAIIRALHSAPGFASARPSWTMVDIRPECRLQVQDIRHEGSSFWAADFLEWSERTPGRAGEGAWDIAITNPPFSLAMPILQRCLAVADVTILLLRLNWVGSEDRHPVLTANPPDLYILPNRPAFIKNAQGKWATDSIEYAWFVWDKAARQRRGHPPVHQGGHYELLSLTPLSERRHD